MTNKLPLVSIVTPSFNQARFLEATLRSVLRQDYLHLETIVVDGGGATDGSLDILRRYRGKLTRWLSEPDRGQADAVNKGQLLATGEVSDRRSGYLARHSDVSGGRDRRAGSQIRSRFSDSRILTPGSCSPSSPARSRGRRTPG